MERNFFMLSEKYQTEQGELEETIQTLQARLQKSQQESCDAEQWIAPIFVGIGISAWK